MNTKELVELSTKLILLATTTDKEEQERLKKEIAEFVPTENREEEWERFLKFTEKEISKMPKYFRKEFRTDGLRCHIRKRIRGNSINYEIRCRRQGYNISASGITVNEAKQQFIKKLNTLPAKGEPAQDFIAPTAFTDFALDYFENYRKRKVTAATYGSDYRRLRRHILPHFEGVAVKDITPRMCQALIDRLSKDGKGKTAEEVFSLLNCILKYAIRYRLIKENPLDLVLHDKHEREHGKALTKEEEKRLIEQTPEPFKTLFAIGLYTGLRPNEYASILISDGMIYARNSKRKHGKEETKRIPVSPMLRPFLENVSWVEKKNPEQLRYWFNAVFGNAHKLYDLRTTFYTRCKEYGINPAARDEFMGHSSGTLGNAYTDLSDEFLKAEMEKLKY